MITLSLTIEQLATIERALNDYAYELVQNFEASAFREDELRLVEDALDVIDEQVTRACHVTRFVQDPPWDKTKYETYDDYLRSLGADL